MFDKHLSSRTWKGKKERRKKFRNAKAIDTTCCNHGSCTYCVNNRTYFDKKARLAAILQLDDIYYTEPDEYEGYDEHDYFGQYWKKHKEGHSEDRDV